MIKLTYILPLWVMVYIGTLNGGTIKGIVRDKNTNEPLYNCNVLLVGTTKGASTEMNGSFIITNVKQGNYILQVAQVGYCTVNDSIIFSSSEQETSYVGIILAEQHFFELSDTPESMIYQDKVKKWETPVSIILNNPHWDTTGLTRLKNQAMHESHYADSDESRENAQMILSDAVGFLKLDCSIINHTDIPIYLFLDYQHVSFQFDPAPESRRRIPDYSSVVAYSCQPPMINGIFVSPDSIEVLPHQTLTNVPLYIFNNFHGYFDEGEYSLKMKYSFNFPLWLNCDTPEWQRSINRLGLRGEFVSENTVTFEVK